MSDDFDDFEIDGEDIDLDNVPDSANPPGARYLCTIAKMEKKKRKDGNGSYMNIQFKIDDVLDETLEPFIGRSMFDIFNLGAAALWKIKGVITACRGEGSAKGARIPNMTGEQLVLDAFEETYQGRVNLRTKNYADAKDWVGVTMDLTAIDEPTALPQETRPGPNGAGAAAPVTSSAEVEI